MTQARAQVRSATPAALAGVLTVLLAPACSHPTARPTPVPPPGIAPATSVQRLAGCEPGRLQVAYRAGGFGTGAAAGVLVIVNTGERDCRLSGSITVHPLDARGATMRVRAPWRNQVSVASGLLSRDTSIPDDGVSPPPDKRYLEIGLWASRRTPDDADRCRSSDLLAPAAWTVTGAVMATVANTDDTALGIGGRLNRHLSSCPTVEGELQLLTVTITSE